MDEPESVLAAAIAVRQERARRGADLCREALAEASTERGLQRAAEVSMSVSESDMLLDLAKQRARRDRDAARIEKRHQ